MDKKTLTDIAKIIVVETAKGYVKSIALNVAALGLLVVIANVWVKIDDFRKSRKK